MSNHPCPRVHQNLSTPIQIEITPIQGMIEFQSTWQAITPIQKCDQICPSLLKQWSPLSKECDQILVASVNNRVGPSCFQKKCLLNFGRYLNKWVPKFDCSEMMKNVVTISFNPNSLL
jgi:hypothetical protein